jgi:DNA modification methylase
VPELTSHEVLDKRLNTLDGKEWVKRTKSWFVVNPRRRSKGQLSHPAKYPEEMVERFLEFFTRPSSWVLDPFAGIGSTLVASKSLGRNSIGLELDPVFTSVAKERLQETHGEGSHEIIVGDTANIAQLLETHFNGCPPLFDFLITSPPYWDMLRKSRGGNDSVHKERKKNGLKQYYSDSAHDLGNIEDYDVYIDTVSRILEEAGSFLKNGKYLVVVAQNMRDVDGTMRPIAWDIARRLSETYQLKQEQIWCQDNKRLGCWGYPTTYVSNVHHHYCLVFQKS